MFIRIYNGDVDFTVEAVRDNLYELNIINGPDNEHMRFVIDRDFLFELQAKLQVVVENAED